MRIRWTLIPATLLACVPLGAQQPLNLDRGRQHCWRPTWTGHSPRWRRGARVVWAHDMEGAESGTAMRRLRRPSWLTVLSSPNPPGGRANAEWPKIHPNGRRSPRGLVDGRPPVGHELPREGKITRAPPSEMTASLWCGVFPDSV